MQKLWYAHLMRTAPDPILSKPCVFWCIFIWKWKTTGLFEGIWSVSAMPSTSIIISASVPLSGAQAVAQFEHG